MNEILYYVVLSVLLTWFSTAMVYEKKVDRLEAKSTVDTAELMLEKGKRELAEAQRDSMSKQVDDLSARYTRLDADWVDAGVANDQLHHEVISLNASLTQACSELSAVNAQNEQLTKQLQSFIAQYN